RAAWNGFWQGRGQRRPLTGLNEPANKGGITLYTPAWGSATPAAAGVTEAVIYPFPAVAPGADLTGPVVQFTQGGSTPIPAGGAGGRRGSSVGLTNYGLAQQLVRLGCLTGSGLEPGDSTTMAFDGRLLNRPSDRSGERAISEGLFLSYAGVYAPEPAQPVLSP